MFHLPDSKKIIIIPQTVSISKNSYPYIRHIKLPYTYTQISQWCNKYCRGKYMFGVGHKVMFELECDANWFSLKWN